MNFQNFFLAKIAFVLIGLSLTSFNGANKIARFSKNLPPANVIVMFTNCKLSKQAIDTWNNNRGKIVVTFYLSSIKTASAITVEMLAYVLPAADPEHKPIDLILESSQKTAVATTGLLLGNHEFSLTKMEILLKNRTEDETIPEFIEINPSFARFNPQLSLTFVASFPNPTAGGPVARGTITDLSADPSPPASASFLKSLLPAKKKSKT